MYPDSQWKGAFIGGDCQWLDGDGASGRNQDARTGFFYVATVNTPAMAAKLVGAGSQYAVNYADRSGNPFDGGKTYRMNVPAIVVGSFVMLFDPIFQGLAISLMTGEVAATFLSRLAVPVVYYQIARRGWTRRLVGVREDPSVSSMAA